jgi:pyruvate/2-oxoglutarate dehydrogenase complex dihydrolipoamide dehydrogenase (E3) component/uncharacterized membrane protein YdjX (TVP38/TMEM64 family)
MKNKKYDVVVVGAGSGGLTSAVGLAKLGKKVLLIERDKMGGECTNSGCVPSKALIHYANEYRTSSKIAGQNAATEEYRKGAFDYVRSKINEILAEETSEHFNKLGIDVIFGEAVFTGKKSLKVDEETIEFKKAIIATGSSPRPLSVPGLTEDKILTNQNLFLEIKLPEKLLVVGAGPIGLEMGQALARLGCQVTLLDNGPTLARLEDPAIGPILEKTLKEDSIKVIHNANLIEVEGEVALIKTAEGETRVDFDKVLIAIGRVPNIPQGLELAGVATSPHGIEVDKNWQTTNRSIFALGDVAARLKFTHVADDTGRQVVARIASFGLLKVKSKSVPKVTFTNPEIAQVGLSEAEAIATYGKDEVMRIEVPLTNNDRARTDDATGGLAIVIARRLSGKILGANIIGPRAGELIGTITLAIDNSISLYRLRSTIFAYPTYSLILKKAGDYFLAKQFAEIEMDLINIIKKILPKFLILLVWAGLLYYAHLYKLSTGLSFTELSAQLFNFITTSLYAPLLYILVYTIRPLTFFPGTALTILSGVFFGLWGILYTIIGANLSAALAYVVGKYFSKSSDSPGLFTSWSQLLNQNPFLAILTMRLTFMPFDVVNYGAGLLKVPFIPYITATFLGTLLGIATFVAIGAGLSLEQFLRDGVSKDAIDGQFILLSVIIFFLSLLVARLAKYHQKKLN